MGSGSVGDVVLVQWHGGGAALKRMRLGMDEGDTITADFLR